MKKLERPKNMQIKTSMGGAILTSFKNIFLVLTIYVPHVNACLT